ncbi:MAG: hypothetical protein GDA49_10095 [Rhodospirillales bacterium]|nr:hypothetical protein [Rhodospirillales bacterium]
MDTAPATDPDALSIRTRMASPPGTESVAGFVPGPGIERLDLRFHIAALRTALEEALAIETWHGESFRALPLTRRPGDDSVSANDLSGRYWMRADDRYVEEPFEDIVDEAGFSEFVPAFRGTYFEHVHAELAKRFTIGRMRVLAKDIHTCNSWHRDPEPRLHIPIVTNPGSLFIVNHHVTHLPADGSVYFTDTRGYHTALNGGGDVRVHIVAALVG